MCAENEPPQIRKEPVFRIFSEALVVGHKSFFRHQVQLFRDVILGSLDGEMFIIIIEAISLGLDINFEVEILPSTSRRSMDASNRGLQIDVGLGRANL